MDVVVADHLLPLRALTIRCPVPLPPPPPPRIGGEAAGKGRLPWGGWVGAVVGTGMGACSS